MRLTTPASLPFEPRPLRLVLRWIQTPLRCAAEAGLVPLPYDYAPFVYTLILYGFLFFSILFLLISYYSYYHFVCVYPGMVYGCKLSGRVGAN